MAAKSAKARAAARKQRDKWKLKRWYTIRAPQFPWNYKRIGETIGESDEQIVDRVYEITQQEFDGDFTKMHVKLRFRVTEIVGSDAITEFIGHQHQNDHTRRQIRRYRAKIDDVIDVVTTDGFLLRIKPLIITDRRIKSSVKASIRSAARDVILGFSAKSTFANLQKAMMGTDLENAVSDAVKPIYPIRSAVIRKSQLLQIGVVQDKGPSLEEALAEEEQAAADVAAKKAAAIAAAQSGDEDEQTEEAGVLAAAEALEAVSDKPAEAAKEEDASEEAPAEEAPAEAESEDLTSLTVAELKERLKAAGKPVSGKKDELIARLQE